MRRLPVPRLAVVSLTLLSAATVSAGPWSRLPEAMDILDARPGDAEALAILDSAERALEAEIVANRLTAASALLDVYEEVVSAAPVGDGRLERLRDHLASVLVVEGDSVAATDLDGAARRWAMAWRLASAEGAVSRLRPLVLPPENPEPGDRWRSAIDDAELTWLPARQSRVGCSANDRLCRGDEIYFRYVEVPGFWIETTEVSNRRYRRCVEAGWCRPPSDRAFLDDPAAADLPVVEIDWNEAAAFAAWAGRRLPSESEWERAARDGEDRRRFPWGYSRARAPANVWHDGRFGDSFDRLAPVGSFDPSPLGLYDLAGNVWEWCADRYATRLLDLPDDGSPYRGGDLGRVLRGGSWRRTVELARVSSRTWQDDGYAADDVGMRCVIDPTGGSPEAAVGEIAGRVWPVEPDPRQPLRGADLDGEDRVYLERRAMTWLMLESRYDLGVSRAVALIREGVAVDAARELLASAERLMLELADEGRMDDLRPVLLAYRDATEGGRDLDDRRRRFLHRLTRTLRAEGQGRLDAGEVERAGAYFRLALELSPDDALLERSYIRTLPDAGSMMVWPGDGREMVWISGGEQRIGASVGDTEADPNEHPARVVDLDGYWLDRREVTNDEYRRCVDAGVCTAPADRVAFDDPNRADHPVVLVDWYQARSYARWAGKRLPSETEWERAARAGTATPYPWGIVWQEGRCNAQGAAGADRWGASAPVASFPANRWQVFDMLGNASEWVADLYHHDLRNAPRDGRPWNQLTGGPSDRERVVRGGSWDDGPSGQRVSHRVDGDPSEPDEEIGFRCAADGGEPPAR